MVEAAKTAILLMRAIWQVVSKIGLLFLIAMFVNLGCPGLALATSVTGNGDTFHGVGAETNPHYSFYTNSTNTFAAAAHAANANATINQTRIRASSTEDLLIGGSLSSAGANNLTIQQSDGNNTNWAVQWQDYDANYTYQGFDIAFEDSSGDAMVVYADGTATPKYRKYDGSPKAWSGELSATVTRTAGTVYWVKLATNPGTDTIALVYKDSNNELGSLIWDGSAWGNEPGTDLSVTAGATDDFDMGWETSSNHLMIVDGKTGVNGLHYQHWSGAAWTVDQLLSNGLDTTQSQVRVAFDPEASTDCVVAASLDNTATTPDLHMVREAGGAWTVQANFDTTTHSLNSAHVDLTYAGTTHQAIGVYGDASGGTTLTDMYSNTCGAFANGSGGSAPTLGAGAVTITGYSDSSSSNAMFLVNEETAAGDLSAFKYTYNAAPGLNAVAESTGSPITTDTSTVSTQCFDFAYERVTLVPTLGEYLFAILILVGLYLGYRQGYFRFLPRGGPISKFLNLRRYLNSRILDLWLAKRKKRQNNLVELDKLE